MAVNSASNRRAEMSNQQTNMRPATKPSNETGAEKRRAPRHDIDTMVYLLAVDDLGHPHGSRRIGQCRNISAGGISVLCKTPVDARFIKLDAMSYALEFESATIEVLRVQPLGDEFEIAGKFVNLSPRSNHQRKMRR